MKLQYSNWTLYKKVENMLPIDEEKKIGCYNKQINQSKF